MSNPQVPTILATAEHLIRCHLHTRGLRILDILNDPQSRYLEVQDVQIYRRAEETPIAHTKDAVLNKQNIALAIPALKRHEAPQKRVNAYQPKRVYEAYVIAAGYEVRGKLQNNATEDAIALLTHNAETFLPFPEATVSYGPCSDAQPATQVALVNTSFITLMNLGQEEQDFSEELAAAIRELVSSS